MDLQHTQGREQVALPLFSKRQMEQVAGVLSQQALINQEATAAAAVMPQQEAQVLHHP